MKSVYFHVLKLFKTSASFRPRGCYIIKIGFKLDFLGIWLSKGSLVGSLTLSLGVLWHVLYVQIKLLRQHDDGFRRNIVKISGNSDNVMTAFIINSGTGR